MIFPQRSRRPSDPPCIASNGPDREMQKRWSLGGSISPSRCEGYSCALVDRSATRTAGRFQIL